MIHRVVKKVFYLLNTQLSKNIFSMYFVQAARYIIPLLTIPYIARVLGVSSWGMLAFTQAFSLYLFLFVDFGFELSATRKIATNINNSHEKSNILINVLNVKVFFSLFVLMASFLILQLWSDFFSNSTLYWAGIFWALTNTFNLFWFFQGIERVQLLALIDVSSKIIGLLLIFYFVKVPGDEWMVLGIHALSAATVFFISLFIAIKHTGFTVPTINESYNLIEEGWQSFSIRFFSSIYSSASPFILGIFTTPDLVGFYSASEKITRTVKEMMRPITRTLYPHFSKLLHSNLSKAYDQIRLAFFSLSIIGFILTALVYFFAGNIIVLIFGAGYESAIPILKIMSVIIFLSSISNILSIQWMLPNGLDKKVAYITFITFIFFIITSLFLVPLSGGIGMAVSILLTECALITMCIVVLRKHGLVTFNLKTKDDFST